MLKTLKRLLTSREPLTRSHPVFGDMRFVQARGGGYWEADPLLEGRAVSVIVEAGLEGPSEAQATFFQAFVTSLDMAIAPARPLLQAEYEAWPGRVWPSAWREAFQLAAITVPPNGDATQPWELSFYPLDDRDEHLYTVNFEDGQPAHVTVDG